MKHGLQEAKIALRFKVFKIRYGCREKWREYVTHVMGVQEILMTVLDGREEKREEDAKSNLAC